MFVNIKCDECNMELTLDKITVLKMVTRVDGNNYVFPCMNPSCKNNIPVIIEEKDDAEIQKPS